MGLPILGSHDQLNVEIPLKYKCLIYLVLTMSVGVLLRPVGAIMKNRLCNYYFFYSKSLSELPKKGIVVRQLLSAQTNFGFSKTALFVLFLKDLPFLFVFVLCVCLSVTLCLLHLMVFLPPHPKIQCSNCLDIRNPLGKVMERSYIRFELFCSNMV